MVKKKLIELVQERLMGSSTITDVWKQAHPLVVQEYIGEAFNNIMFQIQRNTIDGYDVYGKWYDNIAVQTEGGRYYIDKPCTRIQLPDNSYSVRKITLTNDRYTVKFLPAKPMANTVLVNLGTVDRQGIITYQVEVDRVYFERFDTGITEVDVFAIPSFSDYAMTEDIPIPAGQDVINMVMTYFQKVKEEDIISNNK